MAHEMAYNVFNICTVYIVPLLVIIGTYTLILLEISKKSRESREQVGGVATGKKSDCEQLRRSGVGKIQKAKMKTLKMTVMIVLAFILCWTPYYTMSTWYWIDPDSAKTVDKKLERILFIFAVSNSCVDPIVYGLFTLDFRKEVTKCCCKQFSNRSVTSRAPSSVGTRQYLLQKDKHEAISLSMRNEHSFELKKHSFAGSED
ncbi:DgyrCDS3994 [Dimorphilus gyrociliatus]|uniref:DgyrCDS3994 n=1 Tax=Dimorphilus gyrociliatus TaxID=2664684 RepID=A0A7I8VK54_9ANNE|nr:DgyrCDS3994 [Dimorphilus gyrociliatus]